MSLPSITRTDVRPLRLRLREGSSAETPVAGSSLSRRRKSTHVALRERVMRDVSEKLVVRNRKSGSPEDLTSACLNRESDLDLLSRSDVTAGWNDVTVCSCGSPSCVCSLESVLLCALPVLLHWCGCLALRHVLRSMSKPCTS